MGDVTELLSGALDDDLELQERFRNGAASRKICRLKQALKLQMVDCDPASSPLDANLRTMSPRNGVKREMMNQVPFRNLIEGLQFISQFTRPVIIHAVCVQFI